jgi:hypothetical protein
MFAHAHPIPGAATAGMLLVALAFVRAVDAAPSAAPEDASFDAAPFGFVERSDDHTMYGIRWADPRKVRRVAVTWAEGAALPSPGDVAVEYWHREWNGQPDPVLAERGAGRMGWDSMDDWFNGEWKRADAVVDADGRTWTFTFRRSGRSEFPDLGEAGVTFRKTLKVRLRADTALPEPERLAAFTDTKVQRVSVRIHFGKPAERAITLPAEERVTLEVFNGTLLAATSTGGFAPAGNDFARWVRTDPAGGVIEAVLNTAQDPSDPRYDRTIVTVRTPTRPFSFAVGEMVRGDRILVDDLGVLVTRFDDDVTLESYREMLAEYPGRTVYDRVFDEPEQTLGRAWNDMPLKRPLGFVHGLPGDRNVVYQYPNGDFRTPSKTRWFADFPSERDAARKLWYTKEYEFHFGLPPEHLRGGRELRDGYLPVLRTWWQDGPVHYEQRCVLDKLDGDLSAVRLDDPTVLLMRLRVTNTAVSQQGTARLYLQTHKIDGEKLYHRGDLIMADYDGAPRIRCLMVTGGNGQLVDDPRGVRWSMDLRPGEARTLYFAIPTITVTDDEIAPLRTLHFEERADAICEYWQALTDRGTRIITPEPWLNDFYKAHACHLLINCYKELDTDFLHAHVGTFYYGVYPNESVMMTSDLDRRGFHDEARRNYDAFLHYQGTAKFLGNYQSAEGLFYGAGKHETGNYNKSHGYVMWAMADHWYNTRDRDWMAAAAPKLVAACDWVTRERQATMKIAPDGTKPIEYGFLPAGSLEDVTDFWYWLATNAATVWGFDALAGALADFGHPDADRLLTDAKSYHDDVMRGFTESRIRTPVVRLRDGTYVPKYPSRVYERGRSHGWIRETLEGAMFLLFYKLIPPDAPEAKWILQDYEDNLYISTEYGYAIPNFDLFWFSRGGFSMQAQLLDGPPPYLYRDEVKHYLRAYFNGFASAFYPETRMCNEHSLPELGYPRGDHFKSSDEAQSTFWLRLMFVREDGDVLYLGQAIPRYWLAPGSTIGIERAATYFGPLSWTMTSDVANGAIKAILDPPTRTPPKTIYFRFRHPDAKPIQAVTVNGQPWPDFDAAKEWVVLPGAPAKKTEIIVRY